MLFHNINCLFQDRNQFRKEAFSYEEKLLDSLRLDCYEDQLLAFIVEMMSKLKGETPAFTDPDIAYGVSQFSAFIFTICYICLPISY